MKINTIYNEECINGMNNIIDSNSVDIIVTSPPYNIGIEYNSYNDNLPFDEYLDTMNEFGKACNRVLKNDGSLFLNVGDKASDEFRAFQVAQEVSKHLTLQNTIHWIKSIAIPEHNVNVGHYKPISSERYLNNMHEYIFHFTKDKNVKLDKLSIGVPYADKSNLKRWKHTQNKPDLRDRGNVWFIPYETVSSKKEHPSSFPLKLPEMCIKLHGYNDNTLVLDPFMGIGTTGLTANNLGCNWIGFEIDSEYINVFNKNIS